jgi:hypothetical protein
MKMLFAGLALAAVSFASHAGFIDERTVPVAPAAATPAPAAAAPLAAAAAIPAQARFEVTANDRTVREVLSRWSAAAGWSHTGDHWTLDRDHTISGAASPDVFGADFRTAVRTLISSTELTDQPAQPCFYSNWVVRVIPRAASCDRTVN